MSDPSESVNAERAPAGGAPPGAPTAPPSDPAPAPAMPPILVPQDASASGGIVYDRPEVVVGAAFAGGVLLALILKRLGR